MNLLARVESRRTLLRDYYGRSLGAPFKVGAGARARRATRGCLGAFGARPGPQGAPPPPLRCAAAPLPPTPPSTPPRHRAAPASLAEVSPGGRAAERVAAAAAGCEEALQWQGLFALRDAGAQADARAERHRARAAAEAAADAEGEQ